MSNLIPASFIQDLLSRTDIVDIIQSRVALTKRGKSYLACCPFHNEKNPSFNVSQDKQFYYCFGCHAHGDAINFLKTYDRMEFVDAVAYLATKLGVEIPNNPQQQKQSRLSQSLYTSMEKISIYYQKQLRQSTEAINYLKSRGLTGHTAKEFKIGYAPAGWDSLLKDFKDLHSILSTTGMLIKKDNSGQYYDRFRHRIMFPIRDLRGRIIAFGGRSLNDEKPKYLNSPESPLFHKSSELYGLYEARQKNRDLRQLLIVEGYMDVISLAQHGISYAVATMGTAINPNHLQKVLRYTSRIIFCFDGDSAGLQAAWKALIISLPILRDGMHIRFLILPEGEDPDSIIQKIGQSAFENMIESAETLDKFFFSKLKSEIPINTIDGKAQFAREASRHLNTMAPGVYQKLLFDHLAQILQMDLANLEKLLEYRPQINQEAKVQTKRLRHTHPQIAIALLLRQPYLAKYVSDFSELQEIDTPGIPLLIQLIKVFQQNADLSTGQILSQWQSLEDQQEIARLAAYPIQIPEDGAKEEFLGALNRLKKQYWEQLANKIIAKGKDVPLTMEEKQLLQSLLKNKAP